MAQRLRIPASGVDRARSPAALTPERGAGVLRPRFQQPSRRLRPPRDYVLAVAVSGAPGGRVTTYDPATGVLTTAAGARIRLQRDLRESCTARLRLQRTHGAALDVVAPRDADLGATPRGRLLGGLRWPDEGTPCPARGCSGIRRAIAYRPDAPLTGPQGGWECTCTPDHQGWIWPEPPDTDD